MKYQTTPLFSFHKHLPSASFWLSLLAFISLVVVSFLLFEQQTQQALAELMLSPPTQPVQRLGMALLLVLLLALDVVLPVPSSMVALLAVGLLGFFAGSLVIFVGLCCGAVFGYLLGAGYFRLASGWLSTQEQQQASRLANRLGTLALVCLRGIPVLAEASVLAAGMQHYPLRPFLLVTTLANAGLALAYGYIGSFLAGQDALLLVVLASMVLPSLFVALRSLSKLLQPKAKHLDSSQLLAQFQLSYQYPIIFTDHLFAPENPCLRDLLVSGQSGTASVLIYADQQLLQHNPDLIAKIRRYFAEHSADLMLLSDPITVTAGEACKQQRPLQQLYESMLQHQLDRHCYVLAMGGGALLDAVGYACATFHRGIRLIRIPSTVLAQNDAGVGVKNGINAFGQKNLLGTFCPPTAVVNDFQLLLSLRPRDQLAGLAEAVKVAAIKDSRFFVWLEQHADALAQFEHTSSRYAIRRCAELHLEKITLGGDPFEHGNGRPLDYGHWAAHKLENLSGHRIRHGEAVAVGMGLDALYAVQINLLAATDAERLLQLLQRLGFSLYYPELELQDPQGQPLLLQGLEEFRQHLGGQLSIPMLSQIGRCIDLHQVELPLMQQALQRLSAYRLAAPVPTEYCTE